mmetsp:Transcript_5670/g.11767  ORF Transcript_5670/g.11767 Transcript_5670/m.11767 type:complete len:770 (+) Transcript_5670:337-2646(+)
MEGINLLLHSHHLGSHIDLGLGASDDGTELLNLLLRGVGLGLLGLQLQVLGVLRERVLGLRQGGQCGLNGRPERLGCLGGLRHLGLSRGQCCGELISDILVPHGGGQCLHLLSHSVRDLSCLLCLLDEHLTHLLDLGHELCVVLGLLLPLFRKALLLLTLLDLNHHSPQSFAEALAVLHGHKILGKTPAAADQGAEVAVGQVHVSLTLGVGSELLGVQLAIPVLVVLLKGGLHAGSLHLPASGVLQGLCLGDPSVEHLDALLRSGDQGSNLALSVLAVGLLAHLRLQEHDDCLAGGNDLLALSEALHSHLLPLGTGLLLLNRLHSSKLGEGFTALRHLLFQRSAQFEHMRHLDHAIHGLLQLRQGAAVGCQPRPAGGERLPSGRDAVHIDRDRSELSLRLLNQFLGSVALLAVRRCLLSDLLGGSLRHERLQGPHGLLQGVQRLENGLQHSVSLHDGDWVESRSASLLQGLQGISHELVELLLEALRNLVALLGGGLDDLLRLHTGGHALLPGRFQLRLHGSELLLGLGKLGGLELLQDGVELGGDGLAVGQAGLQLGNQRLAHREALHSLRHILVGLIHGSQSGPSRAQIASELGTNANTSRASLLDLLGSRLDSFSDLLLDLLHSLILHIHVPLLHRLGNRLPGLGGLVAELLRLGNDLGYGGGCLVRGEETLHFGQLAVGHLHAGLRAAAGALSLALPLESLDGSSRSRVRSALQALDSGLQLRLLRGDLLSHLLALLFADGELSSHHILLDLRNHILHLLSQQPN